jgi:hypothetical protein
MTSDITHYTYDFVRSIKFMMINEPLDGTDIIKDHWVMALMLASGEGCIYATMNANPEKYENGFIATHFHTQFSQNSKGIREFNFPSCENELRVYDCIDVVTYNYRHNYYIPDDGDDGRYWM